ncbi:MAG: hypothetical protein ACOY94_25315 [Bacillota bacterium]
MWQKALAAIIVGLMLAGPVTGCARPQQRPEASPAEMSASIARIAEQTGDGGETAAVVFDNHALIAIQLNAAQPGGTGGQPLIGTVQQPPATARDMTDPGKGPPKTGNGPGGGLGVPPATPGGALNPGGSTPGGSPVHTQAAPNHAGGPANDAGTNGPVASPGSMGYAPLDVMHRIANQVKSRFEAIDEVRFAYIPEDARRVQAIAGEIQGGASIDAYRDELARLYERAAPAGVTEFDPMHPAPAHNPKGAPGPSPEQP